MIPSAFRLMLADLPDTAVFPAMRAVILGSEPAYDTDVALWRRHFPTADRLVNLYASVDAGFVSAFVVDRETEVPSGALPAGFSLGDKAITLTGKDGEIVAHGDVGEIVVETTLGTPGYWRRPDLTSEAVRAPDTSDGVWTYRTGDMGFLDRDGSLHVSGRKDGGTKILGQRVETGPVEAALLAIEGIAEAAAVVVEDQDAGRRPRLVAFVAGPSELPSAGALRKQLAASLPRAMVPLEFQAIEAMPRLTGGKVDRNALREMASR